MKRVLVTRLLLLEIAPMLAAAGTAACLPRFISAAFLIAGLMVLLSIELSIRDGAVLAWGGHVVGGRKDPIEFWFFIFVHFSISFFCFFLAAGRHLQKA